MTSRNFILFDRYTIVLEASSMVHRDDPIVDRKLAYHYQVTMHIHAHARLIVRYWRQQKTILVILG